MRPRVIAPLTATAVLLAVVGAATTGVLTDRRSADARTPASAPTVAVTSPGASSGATESAAGGAPVPGPAGSAAPDTAPGLRPARIEVPTIGVDAPVGTLGVSRDGSIEVPSIPSRAGWLETTSAPGQRGPAVIAGHVDSDTGPAVFYRLASLQVGDPIRVVREDGTTVDFSVDGVRLYPQSRFPSSEVYGPVPGPALRLITCGGDYVASHGGYQDNVVVYAS